VRQLQHLIERLTILASHGRIDDRAVEEAISLAEPRDLASDTLADTEAEQIRRVLAATGGNKSRAAKILGIERKTLYRKLERMSCRRGPASCGRRSESEMRVPMRAKRPARPGQRLRTATIFPLNQWSRADSHRRDSQVLQMGDFGVYCI